MTRLLLTRSTRTTPNQSGRELATLIVRLIVNDEGTARRREERGRAQACDRQTEKAKMSRLLRISSAYLLFLKSLQKRTRNVLTHVLLCASVCSERVFATRRQWGLLRCVARRVFCRRHRDCCRALSRDSFTRTIALQ